MTLKDKMKTYNFWISLVSAVLLLVRIIGDKYGFAVDAGLVMDITTGVCGIFVILGIISAPSKNQETKNSSCQTDNQGENINESAENQAEKGEEKVENQTQNTIGRFQNVLEAMKQKAQNNAAEVQKVVLESQNEIEIVKNLIDDVVDVEGDVETVSSASIEEPVIEIEEPSGEVCNEGSVVAADHVEDGNLACENNGQPDELIDQETEEHGEESVAESQSLETQSVADDLEKLISELSYHEKQDLIEMLQR
ncbi:MAG: hypothetical protein IJW24_02720 [Clostridia bacterium]|nr:hypothetical protein [Clostridia bacterium]